MAKISGVSTNEMKIFLVGMPGSGKTYWAKKLGKKLKTGAFDLDLMVEAWMDKSIPEIFAEESGEDVFRKTESKLIRWFSEKKSYVLATGGGTPCFFDNMEWMNKHGLTIWLNEAPIVLFDRLKNDKENRPLVSGLNDAELMNFIVSKKEEREQYYQKAKIVLSGKDISEKGILDAVQLHLV